MGEESSDRLTEVIIAVQSLIAESSPTSFASIGDPVGVSLRPQTSEPPPPPPKVEQPPQALGSGLTDLSKTFPLLTPLSYAIPSVIQLASSATGLKEDASGEFKMSHHYF